MRFLSGSKTAVIATDDVKQGCLLRKGEDAGGEGREVLAQRPACGWDDSLFEEDAPPAARGGADLNPKFRV